ncbi:hypothetical protein N7488_004723 [Penicillium malachiteum]|nr:hypothetical protein N7488_004723 [Penicillium malachiteum]
MDELHKRLFSLPDWGYGIYRTTYTAESDATFPNVIGFLESCIRTRFFTSGAQRPQNHAPEDWPKYRSTIMESPAQLDGASFDDIRAHFETWADTQSMRDRWTKFRVCIIIDEESLQTVKDATVEETESKLPKNKPLRFVKVLEAFPDVDQYDEFPGWMKCWPFALWERWENMQDGDDMRDQYDSIEESWWDDVYVG